MSANRFVSFAVIVFPALNSLSGEPLVPTQATADLLEERPGLKAMAVGERLVALYGVPIASNDAEINTDLFVENFLDDPANRDALGVDGVELELLDSIVIRDGKFKVYTYIQKFEGLDVHGSLVKVVVLLGEPGVTLDRISYVGVRLVSLPTVAFAQDVVTAQEALDVVQQSPEWEHLTDFTAPEMVIFERSIGELYRAWRFQGSDEVESWQFFVNAATGDILGTVDLVLNFDSSISGRVTGYATPCLPPAWNAAYCDCCSETDPECCEPTCCVVEDLNCCSASNCCPADSPDNPFSCPLETPMPGIRVRIVEPLEWAQTVHADGDGNYQFTGLPDNETFTIETEMLGQWVTVRNESGADLFLSTTAAEEDGTGGEDEQGADQQAPGGNGGDGLFRGRREGGRAS